MGNTSIKGRIIDESGDPIEGLIVEVFEVDNWLRGADDILGRGPTDSSGEFHISYSEDDYGESYPDLKIKVFAGAKRLLYESEEFPDVTATTYTIPNFTLNRLDATGWVVTLGTGTPQHLTLQNICEVLIDNEMGFQSLTNDILSAEESVYMFLFYLDVSLISIFWPNPPLMDVSTTGYRLAEELKNVKSDGIDVKIAHRRSEERDSSTLFLMLTSTDVFPDVEEYFDDGTVNDVEVVPIRDTARIPMHAKVAIIDNDIAHVMGSPLLQDFFDNQQHQVWDPRRGAPKDKTPFPIHDVNIRVQGEVVYSLKELFAKYYNQEDPAPISNTLTPIPGGNLALQITRSLRGDLFPDSTTWERGVRESYLRAISNATDYIYFENQYFTCDEIADALATVLENNTDLQLILVINNSVDIPKYTDWQEDIVEQLMKNFPDQVGVFTLWTHEQDGSDHLLLKNYVHSKASVIDDKWLTVGSANLDDNSITAATLSIDSFEQINTEVNIVCYDGVDSLPTTPIPEETRRNLWAEHLGLLNVDGTPNPWAPELDTRPSGGWLQLWNDKAEVKQNFMKDSPPVITDAKILPFVSQDDDSNYLKELGINPTAYTLFPKYPSFDFNSGKWINE